MTQGPVTPPPRSKFPPTFWVANVMELFERGAYYGMNSVLAVYLTASRDTGGLGIAEQSVGFLQSIVYAATYVLPIAGGALADRYGYRRILLVAFSLMAAGYFAAGFMSTYGTGVPGAAGHGHGVGPLQADDLRAPSPARPTSRTPPSGSASITG